MRQTYKKGVLVAEDGKYFGKSVARVPLPRSTMNLRYQPTDLVLRPERAKKIRVIEIVPHQIVTKEIITAPKIEDGEIVPDIKRDILKLVVVERHPRDRECRRRLRARVQIEEWCDWFHGGA